MTGHDDLLARANDWIENVDEGPFFDPEGLVRELVAALRAERADREIADAALENTRCQLTDIRRTMDDWENYESGRLLGSAVRRIYTLLDVPAADTATETCKHTRRYAPPDAAPFAMCPDCGERLDVPAADTATEDQDEPTTQPCASCGGVCHWHDEAWVCDECGDEWYPDPAADTATEETT